jgi:hypothetical protein
MAPMAAVDRAERLGENGRGHVEVLDVVTGRGDCQQMRAHLDEEMAGARHAPRLGQGRRAQPARHPADLLRIRHDEVGGSKRERQRHLVHAVEVLADLDGRGDLRRDVGRPPIIVGADGLFDPGKPFGIEDAAPADGLGDGSDWLKSTMSAASSPSAWRAARTTARSSARVGHPILTFIAVSPAATVLAASSAASPGGIIPRLS